MFNLRPTTTVALPVEDGIVSATRLPADNETSQIKYETATFGLG